MKFKREKIAFAPKYTIISRINKAFVESERVRGFLEQKDELKESYFYSPRLYNIGHYGTPFRDM